MLKDEYPRSLLGDPHYLRLWLSILISSFGNQVTMLALPLTAAVLLQATPSQMGLLTAAELAPFVAFSLPAGVWLDRVRKLPVYVAGLCIVTLVLASVPLTWYLGYLSMGYLYLVGFTLGCIFVTSGSASQIVLTQIVPRERLVEAHAKNALASSGAEVAGPGMAGVLIKLVGAPWALLADAVLLAVSILILRGIRISEVRESSPDRHFGRDLLEGMRFVQTHPLLPRLALAVGCWQFCYQEAMVVQILFATRTLGLTESEVGWCYSALGVGSVLAATQGHRISSHIGSGPCLVLGFGLCGLGWLQLALVTGPGIIGIASFVFMQLCFALGAVLIFINFLALRQAVTPEPLLGRMTSTMRWLILIPAAPGALLGGYLGEHLGLQAALALGGFGALGVAGWAWTQPVIRDLRALPKLS